MPTHFETLGLTRQADAAAIKKTYRKLALKWHPDKNKSEGAEDRFKEISEAFSVLSDPEQRKHYEFELDHPAPPPQPAQQQRYPYQQKEGDPFATRHPPNFDPRADERPRSPQWKWSESGGHRGRAARSGRHHQPHHYSEGVGGGGLFGHSPFTFGMAQDIFASFFGGMADPWAGFVGGGFVGAASRGVGVGVGGGGGGGRVRVTTTVHSGGHVSTHTEEFDSAREYRAQAQERQQQPYFGSDEWEGYEPSWTQGGGGGFSDGRSGSWHQSSAWHDHDHDDGGGDGGFTGFDERGTEARRPDWSHDFTEHGGWHAKAQPLPKVSRPEPTAGRRARWAGRKEGGAAPDGTPPHGDDPADDPQRPAAMGRRRTDGSHRPHSPHSPPQQWQPGVPPAPSAPEVPAMRERSTADAERQRLCGALAAELGLDARSVTPEAVISAAKEELGLVPPPGLSCVHQLRHLAREVGVAAC
jgi:hypothetical protein